MIREVAQRLGMAARQSVTRFLDSGLILLYHRVAHVDPDPWSLAVKPAHFAEHLEILRRACVPLTIEQLAEAMERGSVPHRAAVITFDDGYADNLHAARPLLERHDVPATVFIATGTLGSEREFWWDELEKVFLEPGVLPGALRLEIRGRMHEWDLGDAAVYTSASAADHHSWTAWQKPPSARHRTFLMLRNLLQPLDNDEQYHILDQLLRWANVSSLARSTYRILSQGEVAELGRDSLIEIGAHTISHPVLSRLSLGEQEREIRGSKASLEDIIGRPVRSFAYPFGGRKEYDETSIQTVRNAHLTSACTSFDGAVTRYTSRYQMPRVYMEDMDGDRFNQLLSRWLPVKKYLRQ